MRFYTYALNENMVDRALDLIKRVNFKKAKNMFKDSFEELINAASTAGIEPEVVRVINKNFGTRYRSLEQIKRERLRENEELNEDLAHWWEVVKSEGFPSLAFYPMLTVWMEIDKLFKGQDMDMTKTIVYALFWILLVSGKYIKGWSLWKKQNPDEYHAERSQGKGGIV